MQKLHPHAPLSVNIIKFPTGQILKEIITKSVMQCVMFEPAKILKSSFTHFSALLLCLLLCLVLKHKNWGGRLLKKWLNVLNHQQDLESCVSVCILE